MTNEELVALVQSGTDKDNNMLLLYWQNTGLIRKIAKKYAGYAEMDDLLQEGYIGLNTAVNGYDPENGAAFSTYAGIWIKQAIKRYVENSGIVRVPNYMHKKINDYRKAREELLQESGHEPTEDDIKRYMGLSDEEYNSLYEALSAGSVVSLDTPLKSDGDGDLTVGDMVPDKQELEAVVIDKMQEEGLARLLWDMVDSLPEDQPTVVRARYRDDRKLTEIADSMNCTVSQARDKVEKGIRELRKSKYIKRIRPFLPDKYSGAPYRGNGVARFQQTWTSSTEKIAIKLVER